MHPIIADYLVFLLQTATVVVAIGALLLLTFGLAARTRRKPSGRLTVRKLNDAYKSLAEALTDAALPDKQRKKEEKGREKTRKKTEKSSAEPRAKVFVVDFKGDMRASRVASLRYEVTAIIGAAVEGDEVVLRLESPGGAVSGYGLAASQLERLRAAKIPMTAVVDKVAASGGYMMAAVADTIVAAPFAAVGSIGVVMGMPNLRRWLTKHDVDYEQITAGKYKRTLTMLGENTDEARAKMQSEMEAIHRTFKELVARYRPNMDLDVVATGEWWLGAAAKDLGLVDELGTSDDVLLKRADTADLLRVSWEVPRSVSMRLGAGVRAMLHEVTDAVFSSIHRY